MSMTWKAIEGRATTSPTQSFRKADGLFWLVTLASLAGLFAALYR